MTAGLARMAAGGEGGMGEKTHYRATAGLFALALAIGGAGLSFPLLQSFLILTALAVLGWFAFHEAPPLRGQFAGPIVALLAAGIALPLLQLIPLPPDLWTLLPGREQARDLDGLIGWAVWRPWTLDVEATIRSVLVLIPGAVLMIAFLRLSATDRVRLLWLAVAVALASALLGIAQAASGGRFIPYASAHSGFSIGLFVNRNHQAALLLAAMPIAAALGALRLTNGKYRNATVAITLSVVAIFAITVIGTTSRMALLVLPVMLAVSLTLLFLGQSIVRLILPAILGLIGLAAVIWLGGGLTRNLARFASLSDARYDYWTDLYWSLGHYSLAGTGIGTFIPVHKSAESLDTVTAAVLNHAHNDYIELLLEGGIAALILMGLFFALLAVAVVRKFKARESREATLMAAAAASAIVSILIYSLVDYPLRMPAIAALFALLLTFVLPSKRSAGDRAAPPAPRSSPTARSVMRGGALLTVAAFALVTVQAGVSARLLNTGQPAAARWAPWSTQAHRRDATNALIADRDVRRAVQRARAALRLSPIDAASVRTLGVVAGLAGDQRKSARLMTMSAVLGWRDPITQIWAIDTARRANDPLKAVQRAEALYRQNLFLSPATRTLLSPPIAGAATELLVRELARMPSWRRAFLRSLGQLTPASLPMAQQVIERLGRTAAPPSLDEAGPLLDRLASSGQIDARERLWRSLHTRALIDNGDFERTSDYRGPELPSDWDISSEDAASVSIDRPGLGNRGSALRLFQTRAATPLIAQQMMLPGGRYRLRFAMRADKGPEAAFEWEVRCLETGASSAYPFRVRGSQNWQSITLDLDVPNQDCRNQRLALRRVGDTVQQAIWLDSVALSGPR